MGPTGGAVMKDNRNHYLSEGYLRYCYLSKVELQIDLRVGPTRVSYGVDIKKPVVRP